MKDIQEHIRWRTVAAGVSLAVLFLVETLIIKGRMLARAGSLSGLPDVFRAARIEMLWLAVLCLLLVMISSVTGLSAQKWLVVSFAVLVMLSLLALLGHFALFLTTGLGFTPEYLRNWAANRSEVSRMVLSEVRPLHVLAVLFQTGLVVFLALFHGSGPARKIERGATPARKRTWLGLLALFFIFLEAGALLPALSHVNGSIIQVPAIQLVRSFFPGKGPDAVPVVIRDEERMDGPIELEPGPSAGRPNIVLIIFESLSWKYCDAYEPGFGATPYLKELGDRGLVVDNLYTVLPHTSKAIVSILGGIYPYLEPAVLEAGPDILPKRMLPHLLKRAGYRTAFFQTANHYEERPAIIANFGFDMFKGLFDMPQDGFADVNYFGKEEKMMLGPSLDWVDENRAGPFFLTYLTLSTHHHYGTPPGFALKDYGTGNQALDRYLNAARYTDGFIKEVVEGFRKRGLIGKTVFIIVGDHGEGFMEHLQEGHNYILWEEGLRVPGIIYGPGVLPGTGRINGARSLLDIVPTACELAGLEIKSGKFLGTSLFHGVEENRAIFFSGWSREQILGMKEGAVKYISWPRRNQLESYDNSRDPADKHDLCGQDQGCVGKHAGQLAAMNRWADVVNAQYVEWKIKSGKNTEIKKQSRFNRSVSADLGGLLSIYGYEFFPEEAYPGRSVWVRIGLKCTQKVRRPVRATVIFRHEDQADREKSMALSMKTPSESLLPGEFASAETIFTVPEDWPAGKVSVLFGVLDEKSGTYLAAEAEDGAKVGPDGLLRLGTITVHAGEQIPVR